MSRRPPVEHAVCVCRGPIIRVVVSVSRREPWVHTTPNDYLKNPHRAKPMQEPMVRRRPIR